MVGKLPSYKDAAKWGRGSTSTYLIVMPVCNLGWGGEVSMNTVAVNNSGMDAKLSPQQGLC